MTFLNFFLNAFKNVFLKAGNFSFIFIDNSVREIERDDRRLMAFIECFV